MDVARRVVCMDVAPLVATLGPGSQGGAQLTLPTEVLPALREGPADEDWEAPQSAPSALVAPPLVPASAVDVDWELEPQPVALPAFPAGAAPSTLFQSDQLSKFRH